jgi:hypothetical protein
MSASSEGQDTFYYVVYVVSLFSKYGENYSKFDDPVPIFRVILSEPSEIAISEAKTTTPFPVDATCSTSARRPQGNHVKAGYCELMDANSSSTC